MHICVYNVREDWLIFLADQTTISMLSHCLTLFTEDEDAGCKFLEAVPIIFFVFILSIII